MPGLTGDRELWTVFTQEEADLIEQALNALLHNKLEAMKVLNDDLEKRRQTDHLFREEDFAIPEIRALIERFNY
jgi:hypothetical protein